VSAIIRRSYLILIAVAFNACVTVSPHATPDLPHELTVTDDVLQNLFEIQAEYQRETVRCLTGYVVADTVVIDGVAPTWITRADNVSVNFRSCSARGVVGWYHNHPGWYEDGVWQSACSIEGQDVSTLRQIPEFIVGLITCDDAFTLVWVFKDDATNRSRSFAAGDRYRITPTRRES
jgi:hypothetical protein